MPIGRALIALGLLLVVAGALVMVSDKLPFKLGRLPGDIVIQGKNGVYFPIVSCLLLSAVLTLIGWIIGKFR